MNRPLPNPPRSCRVTSHQFCKDGIWHGFIFQPETALAIVELEDGRVETFDMASVYHIQFTDIPTCGECEP